MYNYWQHRQPAGGSTRFFPLPQSLMCFSARQPAGHSVALLLLLLILLLLPDVEGQGDHQLSTHLHPALQMFNLVSPPPPPPPQAADKYPPACVIK